MDDKTHPSSSQGAQAGEQSLSLGLDTAEASKPGHYQVLARKYRPQNFADLIGQEPMVRTLTNAFASGRIAHAFMLTGVRGVGKTTTARLIARALNWQGPGGEQGPQIDLSTPGIHCEAIAQSRHVDVMEMDAASRTGIGDIREIIDSVRYAPAHARFKVYIIDEVHMLSTQAFNGLLKTLEEPPPHVKFIFATTEIRKVPVTVLSRCQRFDLRRVEADRLIAHLNMICAQENVQAEQQALALLAHAAQGSVRDGLSLLDQAIAHAGSEGITAQSVRDMLGLADQARVLGLFEHLMGGRIKESLEELGALYEWGADPLVVLQDLAGLTHWITRLKIVEDAKDDLAVSEAERMRGRSLSEKLSMPALARAWQMLLKGINEVQLSTRPLQAAEMVLIRLAYVSELPAPAELVGRLEKDGTTRTPAATAPAATTAPARTTRNTSEFHPAPSISTRARKEEIFSTSDSADHGRPQAQMHGGAGAQANLHPVISPEKALAISLPDNFEDLVALAAKRDISLRAKLEIYVRLVRYQPGELDFVPAPGAPDGLANEMRAAFEAWTGYAWRVQATQGPARPTLRQQAEDRLAKLKRDAAEEPLVRAALEIFPGAEILSVRENFLPDAQLPPVTESDDNGASDVQVAHDNLSDASVSDESD